MTGRLYQDDEATKCEPDWMASLSLDYAQSRYRGSRDQQMIGKTGATCVNTTAEERMGLGNHAATNEVASGSCRTGKRTITKDTSDGFAKRLCSFGATIRRREDGGSVALAESQAARRGHLYSHVYTDGHARVHMGDSYGAGTTINHNNYSGLCAAMNMRLTQDIEPTEEAAILRLAAVIIVAAIANVIVQPFLLLRNALHRAIPNAVQRRTAPLSSLFGSRMVLFEDALGRFERIDINVVTDWTSFHYNLTRAFAEQPGHRRVAVAGYRLFDQAQGTQLIDPRRPPPFASVFARNKHVRMSIHFAWDEVTLECCPKCGLKQICELDRETTCKAKVCGFSYRGHIKESPIVELDDDDDGGGVSQGETPRKGKNMDHRTDPRRRLPKNEQENPAWFSRISVSQQPEETSARENSETGIDSHGLNLLTRSLNRRPIIDMKRRNAISVAWGELQDEYHDVGARIKRRAQSPIARERITGNGHSSPLAVWDPYSAEFLQHWDATFPPQPDPEQSDQNTAAEGSSDEPFALQPKPLSSGLLERIEQIRNNRAAGTFHGDPTPYIGGRHDFSLPLPSARSNRDPSHLTELNRNMEELADPKLAKLARKLDEELQASRFRR